MIDSPVFLVGSERSGTTLLRLMLDHHPEIAFNLESDYLVSQLSDSEWPDMTAYRRFLDADRMFAHSRFQINATLDYVALVNDFLEQKRRRDGKPIVGATVHHDFDRLPRVWPNARFLYLLRDGRDVTRSVIQMGWAGNMWNGARYWLEAEAMWDHLRGRLRKDQWIEIRYESLVADAQGELDRVCQFMGSSFDPAMFDYVEKTTYGMPDVSLTRQWERKLSEYEVRLAEAAMGSQLARRGYQLSGLEQMSVTPDMIRRLGRQDRMNGVRQRFQKFGIALTMAEIATRRIGLGMLQRPLQRRMDAIVDANLRS